MPLIANVVAFTVLLIVVLPTFILDVVKLTLAPTFIAVDILAVAGSLAVSSVPVVIFDAFDAKVVALVYAVAALPVIAVLTLVPLIVIAAAEIFVFTVLLPTFILEVVKLTLAPTFKAVDMLAVAGNLAVTKVPDAILSALDA